MHSKRFLNYWKQVPAASRGVLTCNKLRGIHVGNVLQYGDDIGHVCIRELSFGILRGTVFKSIPTPALVGTSIG